MTCCKKYWMLARVLAQKKRAFHIRRFISSRKKRAFLMLCLLKHHRLRHTSPNKKGRRWWVRPLFENHDVYGAWCTHIPEMRAHDHERFYNFFRIWPDHFDSLLSKVEPFLQKHSWRKSIPPGERLAITLRYMASGDSHMSLSYLFRVSDQAISQILLETCHVMWRVLSIEVFEKPSEELWLRVAAEVEVMWQVPNCIGALDGMHVNIKAFAHVGTLYFNYKKRHSVSVLAVSDAKQCFLVVESGACGSRGDGNIFHFSELNKRLRSGTLNLPPPTPVHGVEGNPPFMLLGDAAYPRMPNLQTPFKGSFLDAHKEIFNMRLFRGRRCVENAFGILQKRLQVFQSAIEGCAALVKCVILCGFALHNFHMKLHDSLPPNRKRYVWLQEGTKVVDKSSAFRRWKNEDICKESKCFQRLSKLVSVSRGNKHEQLDGYDVQDKLIHYFIANPVPWQWKEAGLL